MSMNMKKNWHEHRHRQGNGQGTQTGQVPGNGHSQGQGHGQGHRQGYNGSNQRHIFICIFGCVTFSAKNYASHVKCRKKSYFINCHYSTVGAFFYWDLIINVKNFYIYHGNCCLNITIFQVRDFEKLLWGPFSLPIHTIFDHPPPRSLWIVFLSTGGNSPSS